jgi:hypothetical protein
MKKQIIVKEQIERLSMMDAKICQIEMMMIQLLLPKHGKVLHPHRSLSQVRAL